MGATFGHIHILNKANMNKELIINRIESTLKSYDYEKGCGHNADLNLKVFFNPHQKWISVYNEILDNITIPDLIKQSELFYEIFSSDVIASHVYDSDVILMNLHGSKKDFYVSDPYEMYVEDYGYNPETTKGSIKRWKHLINKKKIEQDLIDLWGNDEFVLAEDKLKAIGEILGFDSQLSICGYHDCHQLSETIIGQYEVIELAFVNKMKPYQINNKDGLPKFEPSSWSDIHHVKKEIAFEVSNEGGASAGCDVLLFGEAVENQLFNFDTIKLTYTPSVEYKVHEIIGEVAVKEGKLIDGRKVLIAAFDDFKIPQGIDVSYFHDIIKKIGISHGKLQDEVELYKQKTKFSVRFKVSALTDEMVSSDLTICILPKANKNGYVIFETVLSNDEYTIDNYHRKSFERAVREAMGK